MSQFVNIAVQQVSSECQKREEFLYSMTHHLVNLINMNHLGEEASDYNSEAAEAPCLPDNSCLAARDGPFLISAPVGMSGSPAGSFWHSCRFPAALTCVGHLLPR